MGYFEQIMQLTQPGQRFTSGELLDLIFSDNRAMRQSHTGHVSATLFKMKKYGFVRLVGIDSHGCNVWQRVE